LVSALTLQNKFTIIRAFYGLLLSAEMPSIYKFLVDERYCIERISGVTLPSGVTKILKDLNVQFIALITATTAI
jgi:hypothetical protein